MAAKEMPNMELEKPRDLKKAGVTGWAKLLAHIIRK